MAKKVGKGDSQITLPTTMIRLPSAHPLLATHDQDPLNTRLDTKLHIRHALYPLHNDRQVRVFLPRQPSRFNPVRVKASTYPDETDVVPCQVSVLVSRDDLADPQW